MSKLNTRKSQLAQIHIAKKYLDMDRDTYEAFLLRVIGESSSAGLDMHGRFKLIQAFKDNGWKPNKKRVGYKNKSNKKHGADSKFGYDNATSRKLIALWRELAGAGKINDNSARAMEIWIANQTNIPGQQIPKNRSPDTLSASEVNVLIERLKNWLAR